WMEPHYDGSIKDVMLSYVTPVYCGEDIIAVLGIDINFHKLLEEIDEIKYKTSGYMYLKSGDGKVHYHPETNDDEQHGDEADLVLENADLMSSEKTENKVIHYRYHDLDRVMVFVTLRNGMKLILCDSYDEIFEARDSAINTTILITMSFAILFVAVSAIIAHRINSPLRQLARVARSLSKNLNSKVEFPKDGQDEVGDLTRALKIGLSELQSQHALLENMAYYDHLTKVRNSASYSKTIEALDEDIKKGEANFGVVMLDVNFLKEVNDHYGHATGDLVLTRCAEVIQEAFIDDEVFRVGGDEFVAILRDERIKQAENCLRFLDRIIDNNNEKADRDFMKISISYGFATHEKKDYNYEAVYRRADRKMYEMKHKIHAGRKKKPSKNI
ncbi:MAG: GGDEF domain-containing protein, partial [Bacilli bacterium]|nr:GGDEF domain-containing protein [Bacilli bacterium]